MNGRDRRKLKVHWIYQELLPFAMFQKKIQSVLWSHKLFSEKMKIFDKYQQSVPDPINI